MQAAQLPSCSTCSAASAAVSGVHAGVCTDGGAGRAAQLAGRHLFIGVQSAPSLQATQLPSLHTWFIPQPASFGVAGDDTDRGAGGALDFAQLAWLAGHVTGHVRLAGDALTGGLQTFSAPQAAPPGGSHGVDAGDVAARAAERASVRGLVIGTQASVGAGAARPVLAEIPAPQLKPLSALPVARHWACRWRIRPCPCDRRFRGPGTRRRACRRHTCRRYRPVGAAGPVACDGWSPCRWLPAVTEVVPRMHGLPVTTQSLPWTRPSPPDPPPVPVPPPRWRRPFPSGRPCCCRCCRHVPDRCRCRLAAALARFLARGRNKQATEPDPDAPNELLSRMAPG